LASSLKPFSSLFSKPTISDGQHVLVSKYFHHLFAVKTNNNYCMKNTTIFRLLTAVFLAAVLKLGISSATAQTGSSCCISLPQPNHATNVLILDYQPTYLTATSLFEVTLESGVGAVPAGTYAAWCVDSGTELNPAWATIWSGSLISTCDTNELSLIPNHGGTPPVGPPPIVTATTWNEINYILNNRGTNFYWDVETAINSLVGGPPLTNNPAYSIIPQNPAAVAALLAAAAANPYYQAPCGGVVGIIFNSDDVVPTGGSAAQPVQLLILEVPLPTAPTANCATINAVQGVPITSVTLTGSGGCGGPYTFGAVGLPNGLTMSSNGTISGTPSVSGTFNYTIAIADNCGDTGTVNCSVTVNCGSGQIGDFVWNDLNGNGCQDVGEPGIAGVQVVLYSGACGTPGTAIATNYTDNNGHYLFTGLCAGNYQVAIYTPAGYTATVPNQGCTNPNLPPPNNQTDSKCSCGGASPCITCVTLAANQSDLNVDCGYVCNGQIGDFVWNDGNGNGCQDPGEPGIAGVRVDLYSGCGVTGTPIMTTNTDATGHYLFGGLCISNFYTVSFNAPAGYLRTVGNSGCVNTNLPAFKNQLDSKCACAPGTPCGVCVMLSAASPTNLNVDCGYYRPPSANCVTVNAVVGTPIIPVTLMATGGCSTNYTFTASGLPGGLTMSPTGTISGTPSASGTFNYSFIITDSCGNKSTNNCSVTVITPPSANCVTINAVVGKSIIPVTLMGTGGCSTNYSFTASGLPGGLTMSPTGTISGTPSASGTFTYSFIITDSCGNKSTNTCSVTVGGCNGQIGDYVWNDLNGNGCQDTNEPGIAGVQVVLYNGSCTVPGTAIATNYTDSTGHYLFTGLCPGTYQVAITTPTGYTATTANVGCVNTSLPSNMNQLDSKGNCCGASPCITCVTLTTATPVNLNIDYGFTKTCVPGIIGGVDLRGMADTASFFFADGSQGANWQGATKGFAGNVIVSKNASFTTSGSVPFAGTIYTDGSSIGQWQMIVNQQPSQAFASFNNTALVASNTAKLNAAFAQINALPATPGYTSVSSTSLNGLNTTTADGVGHTYVINITSGFQVSSQINITGNAGDVFILRWDSDANFSNGYQGQVKFQSGGAIVPHGGLTPASFINVAGDIASSGGGSNPPAPYPQGPGIANGANFGGGGFFTGYWLTTGDPVTHKTSSLSNGIFVGGWYTTTVQFSMTSGTSGIYVAPTCPGTVGN